MGKVSDAFSGVIVSKKANKEWLCNAIEEALNKDSSLPWEQFPVSQGSRDIQLQNFQIDTDSIEEEEQPGMRIIKAVGLAQGTYIDHESNDVIDEYDIEVDAEYDYIQEIVKIVGIRQK